MVAMTSPKAPYVTKPLGKRRYPLYLMQKYERILANHASRLVRRGLSLDGIAGCVCFIIRYMPDRAKNRSPAINRSKESS